MPNEDEESPKDLRSRLSETHGVAAGALARAAIAEHGLTHIKPEDLPKGTPLDEIESTAVSLNQQREEAGLEAMKQTLAAKGIEDVDAAVAQLLDGSSGEKDPLPPGVDQEAIDRARRLGGSGAPIRTEDITHLGDDGPAQMLHYFKTKG